MRCLDILSFVAAFFYSQDSFLYFGSSGVLMRNNSEILQPNVILLGASFVTLASFISTTH